MSVQALTWAAKQTCGSPLAKLILITLSDWSDECGVWLLDVKRLSSYCEATEGLVERALADLFENDHLRIVGAMIQLSFSTITTEHWTLCDGPSVPSWRISRSKRFSIYARDGHACVYCGDTEKLSLDHVVPRSKGGCDSETNLVTACQPCNSSKKDRDLSEWEGRA